ncbi:MAG: PhzF family phenazine biosynthesis protein [Alphaproteobacteria bacterium]|nr:PhzF family phenazine biosynthesis protein [Alphaproteobacteria bacterium]
MPVSVYDAFAEHAFEGNPAAVVVSDEALDESLMQRIAGEMNLSETAFLRPLPGEGRYALRWFTPTAEVDLCGHATLAAGALVLDRMAGSLDRVTFETRSGPLRVLRVGRERYAMEFPRLAVTPLEVPLAAVRELEEALGGRPVGFHASVNLIADYPGEAELRALVCDPGRLGRALEALGFWGLSVTAPPAPGADYDFVSRFFAPRKGIPEDPVTGAAHCALAPLWAGRLGKRKLLGYQASRRGGFVGCELLEEDRVRLEGACVRVLAGALTL